MGPTLGNAGLWSRRREVGAPPWGRYGATALLRGRSASDPSAPGLTPP